jgi:hypothetical protein
MRNIVKIVLCFMFGLGFASFAQAQKVKTVTGYLCGQEDSGNTVWWITLQVGPNFVDIAYTYGPLSKRYLDKLDLSKIGSEAVVRYRRWDNSNVATSIRFTGRTKKIKPCP